MSFESTALVLRHSRATGAARSILIGIASHEGDGGAWPSMETLAIYGNVSTRGAQKAVAQLVALGELAIDRQGGGTAATPNHRRPNRYEVLVTCPAWCDGSKNHRDTRRHNRGGSRDTRADNARGSSAARGEPQFTPPPEPQFTPPPEPQFTRTIQENYPYEETQSSKHVTVGLDGRRIRDLSAWELDQLAGAVAERRAEWPKGSVRTFAMRKCGPLDAGATLQALLRAADDPTAATPGIIMQPGMWWDPIPDDVGQLVPEGPFCGICGYNRRACESLNSKIHPDDGHAFGEPQQPPIGEPPK